MKRLIFTAASLAVFVLFNFNVYKKEKIISDGETVLLELAPVDPRSLMQGDYMRLRYAIERSLQFQAKDGRGFMVITALNPNKVAGFARFHDGRALASGEKLLRFHNAYGRVRIVPDSFMFQEGHAPHYQSAKYGVFKFDPYGEYVLVGLADAAFNVIRPASR